jgi:hypothetical protein
MGRVREKTSVGVSSKIPSILPMAIYRRLGLGGQSSLDAGRRRCEQQARRMQASAPHRHHLLQLRAVDSGQVIRVALRVCSSSASPRLAGTPRSMPWGLDRCVRMFQRSNANARWRPWSIEPIQLLVSEQR